LEFFLLKGLPKLFSDSSQIVEGDLPATFDIEKFEGLEGLFDRISFGILSLHDFQIVFIVDSAGLFHIKLSSQLHNFGFLDVEAQCSQYDLKFMVCDV
jgi:hypothetical protein